MKEIALALCLLGALMSLTALVVTHYRTKGNRMSTETTAPAMKIFQLDDCDWYAATDLESAIQFAMNDTGLSREDFEDAREIPEGAMRILKYHDSDDEGGPVTIRTFAEQLAIELQDGKPFPRLFASTEY